MTRATKLLEIEYHGDIYFFRFIGASLLNLRVTPKRKKKVFSPHNDSDFFILVS